MKIVNFQTYVVGTPPPHRGGVNWIFLKLTTDEGIEGIGEASRVPFEPRAVVRMIEDIGKQFVVGFDPFNIEKLYLTLYSNRFGQDPNLTKLSVISAFEMACWDIIGKALKQPIYNLLGGKFHEKLRAYTYITAAPEDATWQIWGDPELASRKAEEYVKLGFTAIKLDPVSEAIGLGALGPRELSLEGLRDAEAVVKSVRDVVGDKCDILIGTHGQMTTHSAIRLAKRLEKYDPLWFEEPVPPTNVNEMARVARSTSIPIATGERLVTKHQFAELLEKQAAAILQFDPSAVGILEGKKIAGMAEAHYAQIAPHMYIGPVAGAACIQLDVCSPNFLIQEGVETWGGFHAEILKEPIQWENGYIIPPTKPGLGVELNEAVAAKYPYQQQVQTQGWP